MESEKASSGQVQPLRVLIVEVNEDGTVGGSHQVLFDSVRLLDRSRVRPLVAFYQENCFRERLQTLGVEVHVLDKLRVEEVESYRTKRRISRYRALRQAIRIRRRLLEQLRIDLVHINNSPQVALHDWLPAARSLGIPIVASAMGDAGPIDNRLRRWLVRGYNHYLAVSEYMLQELQKQGVPKKKITLVRNGIDIAEIRARILRSRQEVRHELGLLPHTSLGVMVGNIRPWKGQDVVLDALARLPPRLLGRVVIAFAGAEDPSNADFSHHLREKASDLGIDAQVRWLGRREDIPELFAAADFGLHASVVPEPFGLVMVECMATGTPVIAAREGGAAEIVTSDTGWVYPGGDSEALAELLSKAVSEPQRLRLMRENCPPRAQAFSAERMAEKTGEAYVRVATGRTRW